MPALPRLAPSTRAFARPLQALALATFVVPVALVAQPRATAPARSAVDTTALARLTFRSIGPANMMGRSTDVEGVAGNANLVYVGTAAGGVWKTTNGGTTWAPLFDKQPTLSIGDLALEPGNPDVIYAGTGEANVRNSVSFGRGMYNRWMAGARGASSAWATRATSPA
jgi:hypothetical protein